MSRKVGRITLAATLVLAGGVILVDNLVGTEIAWYIGRLWAGLLILLGLEWISAATRAEREGTKATFDSGAIVGLVIVAIIAANVSSWGRMPRWMREARTFPNNVMVDIAVPEIHVPPITVPTVPPINPFGNLSAEVVKVAPLNAAQLTDLTLETSSGNVTVQDGAQAMVEMRVRAYGRSVEEAERSAQQATLDLSTAAGNVTVKSVLPSAGSRMEVSFIVTLPKEARVTLKVNTSSGSINVADRTGSVTAVTGSGSVRAERITGDVDLRSNSGSVTASGITGQVAATSTSGGVLVEAVTGDVRVGATSGSILLRDLGGRVSAQSSSGGITVDTESIGGDYELTAVSGAIRLTMPEISGVSVTAKASSGRVTGPAWLTIGEGRNSGVGTQGDGGFKVNLKTTSGGITLEVR